MHMKHAPIAKRRPINLSLDEENILAARELGLNLSQTCNQALAAGVKKERERRWKEENRSTIEEWNVWIEKNGLPLARYRMF